MKKTSILCPLSHSPHLIIILAKNMKNNNVTNMLISFVFQKSMQLIQDIQTFVIFTLASQINWILIIHAGLI